MSVISRHLDYMMKIGIDVPEQHEQLPSFYSLPKLHKKTYGSRFIAASNKCTTKQLSSLLTSCFKTILTYTQYKQYCDGIYNHSGINCFWVINNSSKVLDRLHQINKTSRARRVQFDSYDFATLYTNIPHDALKNNIRNLVHEAFKIRGAKYLIVNRHGKAHWSLEPASNTTCVSVSKSKLVEWTEYLIDNVYIKVGNNVYRQSIGIPMGTDCAPQLANLFQFHYEYSYMKNLMLDNLSASKHTDLSIFYPEPSKKIRNTENWI